MEKKHILILSKGLLYSLNNVNQGKNQYLSSWATGDFTHLVLRKELRFVDDKETGFNLLGCYVSNKLLENLSVAVTLYFIINIVTRICFRHIYIKKYDCIIARDPILSGLIGFLLSKIIKRPLIVEFNGNYSSKENWDSHKRSIIGDIKSKIAQNIIPFVCNHAKKLKLLYPGQADKYVSDNTKCTSFHEYTPISNVKEILNKEYKTPEKDYVLFLGNPWRTKGVDVLIKAFNLLASNKLSYDLLIVGWFPGEVKTFLLEMVESPNIMIIDAVDYPEALALINGCELLVLPSRTEAMGRVLLEAMAFSRPIIGSDVDGIPYYLVDKKAGFIFKNEDHEDLSLKISLIMSDIKLRQSFGQFGYEYVTSHLNEKIYSEKYMKLVKTACES